MNNEELIRHFKGILTGSASEQDNKEFVKTLTQIAKEGYGERKLHPVYEALETLDDFLEELDEFYGLVALKYGSEAYRALEILHSWYNGQNDEEKQSLTWLERLELEKAMMGRGIDYETAEQILSDFQKRMDRF